MISSALFTGFLIVIGFATGLSAQVIPDSAQTDSIMVDSVTTSTPPEPEIEKPKEPEPIVPWEQFKSVGMDFISDDSLLRWQIWPNWGDFYAYRKDAISFRQGTIGRYDAFQISGFSPYEQTLNLEGIELSNPVTGLVNYNYVPHHKIESLYEQKSANYHSDIELKKYYILEPVSYLNYDEAAYNYRNLEFMVTQNLSERTNIELSFWDRRGGGNYRNNEVLGNQIVARGYHYLNQKVQIRTLLLRNQFDLEEPFGYQVIDPLAFSFGRFSSTPKLTGASSETTRRDWVTGIYFRPDSSSVENMGIEINLGKDDFSLMSTPDTLGWDLRNYSGTIFRLLGTDQLSLRIEGSAEYHNFKQNSAISRNEWTDIGISAHLQTQLDENLKVYADGKLTQRSDGFTDTEIGGGAKLGINNRVDLTINGSVFSRMPTIQELYWEGKNFFGNPALENETGVSVFGEAIFMLSDEIMLGVSGRVKQSNNDAFLGNDSSFVNSGDLSSLSGTAFGSFENHRFEIESSVTIDALNDLSPVDSTDIITFNEQKIWIRNNAFIKGYAFNRAAFVKLGVRTTLSPIAYGSKFFNTELQYWQANSTEVNIPAFFRLDAELSARVRAIMVVMRWENALDGIGQLGYFEAATFPMNARRLIVGIRAQFRN